MPEPWEEEAASKIIEDMVTPADLSGVRRWIDENGMEHFSVTAVLYAPHESRWIVFSEKSP